MGEITNYRPDLVSSASRSTLRGPYRGSEKLTSWVIVADFRVAMHNLGICYDHGSGVPTNQSEATKLFQKEVGNDYMEATFPLGKFYLNGHGLDRDTTCGL